MCGIAGIHFKDVDNGFSGPLLDRLVDKLLLGIEHRGTDATGVVAVTAGGKQVLLHKKDVEASEFIKNRPRLGTMNRVRTVLLHTRFATQGHQSRNENNHPVLYKTCFATHNGHINNDDALFRDYEMRRNAEVDSEIIPALFANFGLDQAHRALQELEGNLAVAVIDPVQFPDKLILAKGNSSPLIFFQNDNFIMWASTLTTLMDAWGACIGTPPKAKRFWELAEGGLLFVDGSESELLEFKVREYSRTTYSTYSGGGWNSNTDFNYRNRPNNAETCKNCGCTAFWHAGEDLRGVCVGKPPELAGDICHCDGFVSAKVEQSTDDPIECETCFEDYPADWMENVWETHWMCRGCLYGEADPYVDVEGFHKRKMCDHSLCETTCLQQRAITTPQLSLVSNRGCSHESCDDECRFPDSILGIKILADETEVAMVVPGIWVPAEGSETNDERHAAILASVAHEAGFHINFVEWILFKAPLDITNNDEWLEKQRDLLDNLYADKEMEFNVLEESVRAERTLVLQ